MDPDTLWEKFLLAKRIKRNACGNFYCNSYFWRSTSRQEFDYVEDYGGKSYAFKFK